MKKENLIRATALVLALLFLLSGIYAWAQEGGVMKITFIAMMCNLADVNEVLYDATFSDIAENDSAAGTVAGAVNAGIIDETFADADGKLNVSASITKEEAVAMVIRTLIAKKNDLAVGESLLFDDKDTISDKYLTYIEVAASNGIVENSGSFDPKAYISREEAAKMAEEAVLHYKRLPVLPNSGIRRIQFPVIEDASVQKPEFISDEYKLVFSDDFDGDSLDTTKWGYNYSWGHSHNHAGWCVPENVIVKDGILTLKGENKKHPDAEGKQGTFNNKKYDIVYTSGAINTHHKFNFDYGYFEARLKMPKGKGMWPAWWMLRDGWPPEIDMLEVLCSKPNELHVNFHYGPAWNEHYSHEQVFDLGFDTTEDFHTYGFEWTPDYMRYYVDGVQVGHDFTNKSAISEARGMYMILNLAIDGWDGTPDASTPWPAEYQCDYVRVWQLNE